MNKVTGKQFLFIAVLLISVGAFIALTSLSYAQSPSWSSGPAMPTARTIAVAEVINGKLYVAVGKDGSGFINTLGIYDPSTQNWGTGAAMPYAMSDAVSGAIGGKLYVVGVASDRTRQVQIYNPATNTWTLGTATNTVRWGQTGGAIGNKLYIIGGINEFGYTNPPLLIYDSTTDSWSTGPILPGYGDYGPYLMGSVVYQGKLYVVGGEWTHGSFSRMLVYDPASNTWSDLAPMPTAREDVASVVLGDKMYVIGGGVTTQTVSIQPIYTPVNITEIYNFSTGQWETGVALPNSRDNHIAAVLNGNIYVAGGYVGGQSQPSNEMLIYGLAPDPTPTSTPSDTTSPPVPEGRSFTCAYSDTSSGVHKFKVTYSWNAVTDTGTAGMHQFPYWSQVSTKADFGVVNSPDWYNTWDKVLTRTSGISYSEGTTLYAHVRSRDALDNKSSWSTTDSLVVNINNCSIDSGFRPDPDGFVFSNTGVFTTTKRPPADQIAGWYPNALQSMHPTQFFGSTVCTNPSTTVCTLRFDVEKWRKRVVDDSLAGFCLGMALDSIFYREGTPRPQGASSTYNLTYNDAVPSIINSFAWQFVPEVREKEDFYRSQNVTQTLQVIQTQLLQGKGVRISVRNPSYGSGGHAVVGYKLEPFESNSYKLWIYDNSIPTGDHFAIFTPASNTATYAWPDLVWTFVRAIPTSVYSGQYAWKSPMQSASPMSPNATPPTFLVVPANTTITVNGVVRPVQLIENGLGYATSGIVLLSPDEIINTSISLGAATTSDVTQDVSVFSNGKALGVSGLNQNDVVTFATTMQSVNIHTQHASTPSVSMAGDIAMGNSEASISTTSNGNARINFSLTGAANLTVRSDKDNLQSASITMKVLQPDSETESVFSYSDLSLSSATALTLTLGTSLNGRVEYAIEQPSGISKGTLTTQMPSNVYLPLIQH